MSRERLNNPSLFFYDRINSILYVADPATSQLQMLFWDLLLVGEQLIYSLMSSDYYLIYILNIRIPPPNLQSAPLM